jgi:hypothetical protein
MTAAAPIAAPETDAPAGDLVPAGLVAAMDFDIVVNRAITDFAEIARTAARFRDQAAARDSSVG